MKEIYGGLIDEKIRLTIDDQVVFCERECSILEAAKDAGIEIPTLCYLKGLTATGACGVCIVEVEKDDGTTELKRACRCRAKDGMVVYTNTPAVQKYREKRITELLSKHPNDCLTCDKTGGNCHFQEVTHLFGINPEDRKIPKRPFDDTCVAFTRDMSKCIACGRCVTVCNEVQKI